MNKIYGPENPMLGGWAGGTFTGLMDPSRQGSIGDKMGPGQTAGGQAGLQNPFPFPQGYQGSSWQQLMGDKDDYERLKTRPYGSMPRSEGGSRDPIEWFRKHGKSPSNMGDYQQFVDYMGKMKSAYNPGGGDRSPYDTRQMSMYPGQGFNNSWFIRGMTPSERGRYSRSRYTYDNGLRNPITSNELSGRGSAEGKTPLTGGSWDQQINTPLGV